MRPARRRLQQALRQTPKSDFDAHRPVRADEDLDLFFTWRVARTVSSSLTLQHDRVRYLLPDIPKSRKLIHRYIDVFESQTAASSCAPIARAWSTSASTRMVIGLRPARAC